MGKKKIKKYYDVEWFWNETYVFNSKLDLVNFMKKNNYYSYLIESGDCDDKIYCRFCRIKKNLKNLIIFLTK